MIGNVSGSAPAKLAVELSAGQKAMQDLARSQFCVVKAGDSLSAIAKQYLAKAALYPKIVEATNQKAKTDSSFATIKNPNLIHPGQKVWIPKNV